jgi:uncharacterized protein (DUF1697 family)
VALHRTHRDEQRRSDLCIRQVLADEREHLSLACRDLDAGRAHRLSVPPDPSPWCDLLMGRYVAFLRAVNVGGRRVAMASARRVLEDLGYQDVASYVNSGNLLFGTVAKTEELENKIRAALEREFGFELTTFVRTAKQVHRLVDEKPFTLTSGDTHFVLLPLKRMSAKEKKAVLDMANDHDELLISGQDVHWLIHGKSTETTLGPKEWRQALPENPTTARNMTMLSRLAEKL